MLIFCGIMRTKVGKMDFEDLKNKKIKVGEFVLMTVPATIEYARDIFKIMQSDSKNMIFWMPDGLFTSPEQTLVGYYNRNNSARCMLFGIFKDGKLLGLETSPCDGDDYYIVNVPINSDTKSAKIFVWADDIKPLGREEILNMK